MKRLVAGLILAMSLTVGTAKADTIGTISVTLPGGSGQLGDAVSITPVGYSSPIATSFGPYTYNITNPSNTAVATLLGTTPANGNSVTLGGYCIALTQGIGTGITYPNFAVQSIPTSGPNAGTLSGLSATQTTNVLKLMADYSQAGGNLTSQAGSGSLLNDALGASIWEATNGKGTDSPSPFVVNGGVNDIAIQARGATSSATLASAVTLANSWLAGLATQTAEEDPTKVFALVGYDQNGNPLQTQVTVLQGDPPAVPEPGQTIGLAGMGLMAMVIGGVAKSRRRAVGLRECEGSRRTCEIA